jgi:hypothetical protein
MIHINMWRFDGCRTQIVGQFHLNSFVPHLKSPQLLTFLCFFCFLTGSNMSRHAPQDAMSTMHNNSLLLCNCTPPWLPIHVVTAVALPSSFQTKPPHQKWVWTGIHGTIYHAQLKICCFIQPLAFYETNLGLLSWQNMSSCSFLPQ